jgi:hypothetical protein
LVLLQGFERDAALVNPLVESDVSELPSNERIGYGNGQTANSPRDELAGAILAIQPEQVALPRQPDCVRVHDPASHSHVFTLGPEGGMDEVHPAEG